MLGGAETSIEIGSSHAGAKESLTWAEFHASYDPSQFKLFQEAEATEVLTLTGAHLGQVRGSIVEHLKMPLFAPDLPTSSKHQWEIGITEEEIAKKARHKEVATTAIVTEPILSIAKAEASTLVGGQ
ncbi:uncharacterized protein A4U43_C06F5220 [Asparagus officinalis]|uniref:Uncharacterized protein n=1 Tax=Asparagus officinalis TaxID=4686 RepID=A0A5P1EJN7_ASPOF|nr:uncharacterized protein A4U43_C06F5220 [Asparagus officinalis]